MIARSSNAQSLIRSLAALVLAAVVPTPAAAQSYAGVWVFDSTSTPTTTTTPASATARRAADSTARDAAGGSLAPEVAGYRSVLTILQLDTAMVVERQLVDRRRRPVAAADRLSYRLDDRERTVPWTAPSGNAGTATVRARRVATASGTPALVLFTLRRVPVSLERTRTTQLTERLELVAGGSLKVTRTEYDGKRERRRVYWFSRG